MYKLEHALVHTSTPKKANSNKVGSGGPCLQSELQDSFEILYTENPYVDTKQNMVIITTTMLMVAMTMFYCSSVTQRLPTQHAQNPQLHPQTTKKEKTSELRAKN